MSGKALAVIILAAAVILSVVLVSIMPRPRGLVGTRAPSRPAPGTVMEVVATGYAPSPYQTDSTPCITASGVRVRRGTAAANFLPFGTLLRINGRVYIVEDRTSSRNGSTVDILFPSTSEALEFGRRRVAVTVLGYGQAGQPLPGRTEEREKEKDGGAAASAPERPAQEPSWLDRIRYRLRGLRDLIKISRPVDVNRYDVDCF